MCTPVLPRNTLQRKRSGLEETSATRTVVRKKNIVPSFDLHSDDDASGSGVAMPTTSFSTSASAVLSPQVPDHAETTLAAALQVKNFDANKAAYYASLFLPVDFGSIPDRPTSAFSPPPPDSRDIAMLFETDEAGELHVDYAGMVKMFYPLVHPNCDEYTIDHATGLRTVRHSFVNMAILPDVLLADDTACRLLDLMP